MNLVRLHQSNNADLEITVIQPEEQQHCTAS